MRNARALRGPDVQGGAASSVEAPAGLYVTIGKPVLDRACALVALLILVPVLIAVALAIRIELGPGVLFRQERIGQNGDRFVMYKFRTMGPDRRTRTPDYEGPDRRRRHKHPNDPRHTGLGRMLRKWSLDELPQLANVLAGHMSLVGPRPELPFVVSSYEAWQLRRHCVKPGLTGYWQISEQRTEPMHEHTAMDIAYVESVSLKTDLTILARTLPATLKRKAF